MVILILALLRLALVLRRHYESSVSSLLVAVADGGRLGRVQSIYSVTAPEDDSRSRQEQDVKAQTIWINNTKRIDVSEY